MDQRPAISRQIKNQIECGWWQSLRSGSPAPGKWRPSMKKIFMLALAMVLAGSATAVTKRMAHPMPKMPDHGLVVPNDMHWGDAPSVFQPGAKMAVLQGDPGAAGPYTVRLKMPDGYRIMPHWHPTRENVTVISGTFHLGTSPKFDEDLGGPSSSRPLCGRQLTDQEENPETRYACQDSPRANTPEKPGNEG